MVASDSCREKKAALHGGAATSGEERGTVPRGRDGGGEGAEAALGFRGGRTLSETAAV
jgi:hypothetical protein